MNDNNTYLRIIISFKTGNFKQVFLRLSGDFDVGIDESGGDLKGNQGNTKAILQIVYNRFGFRDLQTKIR